MLTRFKLLVQFNARQSNKNTRLAEEKNIDYIFYGVLRILELWSGFLLTDFRSLTSLFYLHLAFCSLKFPEHIYPFQNADWASA